MIVQDWEPPDKWSISVQCGALNPPPSNCFLCLDTFFSLETEQKVEKETKLKISIKDTVIMKNNITFSEQLGPVEVPR